MPRDLEPHVPGSFYHVTLRGAFRSEVYFALPGRRLLVNIMGEVSERFAGKLHCYQNFEDALQLLVEVGEEPIGRMMLRVARRYAQCIHDAGDKAIVSTLPDVRDVVNRLFDMRFRRTAPMVAARLLRRRLQPPVPSCKVPVPID